MYTTAYFLSSDVLDLAKQPTSAYSIYFIYEKSNIIYKERVRGLYKSTYRYIRNISVKDHVLNNPNVLPAYKIETN